MKKTIQLSLWGVFGLSLIVALGGCAYSGVATIGKDHVVVTRNDSFLFGALRKVYICKATPNGLKNCSAEESP